MPRRRWRPSREGHHAPPWWPEGEPWPPHGRSRGRAIGRRFAFLTLVVLLLAILAVMVIFNPTGEWRGPPDHTDDGPPGFVPPLVLLGIGALIFFIVRKITRTFRPLAQVIDAADRVAEGDYTARVSASSAGETTSVVNAFNTMAARLEANERQRRQFLSDVTHELRTPLAVVQGTIEGMRDGVYPRDDAHLDPLLARTRAIARLLDDLQTLANTDAGALALHLVETDLATLLNEVAAAFAPVAEVQNVSIAVNSGDVSPVPIDPFRMRQVLDNLVNNALRYTPAGGSITLSSRVIGREALIVVADTGSGMSQETAGRMFERFEKSADSGGSGLGLAIARGLVIAHGGTISAKSAPGKGTTVTIRLPQHRNWP